VLEAVRRELRARQREQLRRSLAAPHPETRTGTPGEGALHPRLAPGPSGLRRPSFALVRRIFGPVSSREIEAIDVGLRLYLGLDDESPARPVP
jgi:hypothetical protein